MVGERTRAPRWLVLPTVTLLACSAARTRGVEAEAPPPAPPRAGQELTELGGGVQRLGVCPPGVRSELELLPHGRLLLARCANDCKAFPIDASGILGTSWPCDLGNPSLTSDRQIGMLVGDWPKQAVLGAWVGVEPLPGDPLDLVMLGLQYAKDGRWTPAPSPERGPVGVGPWSVDTWITPGFNGAEVKFISLGTRRPSLRLPEPPPNAQILRLHHFVSVGVGDALLMADGPDGLVAWRWRSGEPKPVVDDLSPRNFFDPASPDHRPLALRSGTDLWIGVHSGEAGGPEVLHCDGATWTSSFVWKDTREHGTPERIEEILLGGDGAVWVQLSGESRFGLWRRAPGEVDRWEHVASNLFGWDRPYYLKRFITVGADVLAIGRSADRQDHLLRIPAKLAGRVVELTSAAGRGLHRGARVGQRVPLD
jgi:hypothetical protein